MRSFEVFAASEWPRRSPATATKNDSAREWRGSGDRCRSNPPRNSEHTAPVCSCVVHPVLDADLLAVVKAAVIGDAIPAHDETHEMLRQRLSQSTAFDNPRLIYPKRTRHGYFKHQS